MKRRKKLEKNIKGVTKTHESQQQADTHNFNSITFTFGFSSQQLKRQKGGKYVSKKKHEQQKQKFKALILKPNRVKKIKSKQRGKSEKKEKLQKIAVIWLVSKMYETIYARAITNKIHLDLYIHRF